MRYAVTESDQSRNFNPVNEFELAHGSGVFRVGTTLFGCHGIAHSIWPA